VVRKLFAFCAETEIVTLCPELRVPDDCDTLSWPAAADGTDTDQVTGPPRAVRVIVDANGATTLTDEGDTLRAPRTALITGVLGCSPATPRPRW
jgi:hypothetical protein